MTVRENFWSRRRAAVRAETLAEETAVTEAQQPETSPVEMTDEEVLAELGLPDPDTMVAGDDFTAFLARAVPHHIRSRALRRLWRSDPALACLDGLNDYDDDYLSGSYNQPPIKTTYQVGKGMLRYLEDVQARLAAVTDTVDDTDQVVEAPDDEGGEVEAPVARVAEPDVDRSIVVADDSTPAPAPRRMRLSFAEDAS